MKETIDDILTELSCKGWQEVVHEIEKALEEKNKEIERLNNIINEFEDWLNAKYEEMHDIWYVKVLNKLKELKKELIKSENNKH